MGWDWKDSLRQRVVSADEAVRVVKNGDRVVFAMSSPLNTPFAVARALARRAPELRDVDLDVSWSAVATLGLLAPGTEGAWTATSLFSYTEPETKALIEHDPRMDFVPLNPSFIGRHANQPFREEFTRRFTGADVYVVTVTPPSPSGFVTFGANLWNSRAQARNAKFVIGEVNPNLPIIPGGDNWMPVETFDYLVETEPITLPRILAETPEEEVEPSQVCGAYTAELINNGDTVMFGGGAMPFRLAPFLEHKEDLGCHTEVVCPVGLVRAGVINGKKRTLAPGKVSLTGLIVQSEEEQRWIDGNPVFDLRDMELNNHPRYIAQNDNMVAVNAPLEITLWGEIGVERVGPRYFRGVGGQVEFVVGALLSDGGRSIHAVLSRKRTTDGRWVSTIVPEFTRPGVASVSRQFADLVVTEYGVARLLGKTERERAEELISIAHPDFRAELRTAAKDAFGLGRRTIALRV
jgi:4-hydroxybutyrate CoA-transferase